MRKLLYVVGGLVVLLIGALVVVPQFVDLNRYKSEIATEVRAATGRDVTIGGDISLSILPALALVVADVRLDNAEGGVAEHMVRLREAQVEVALLPLISGRYEVTRVRLVDPEIALEVLPDGRRNWDLSAAPAPATDAPAAPADAPGTPAEPTSEPSPQGNDAGRPAVSLESFEIINGTIVYRDIPAGTEERIRDLDATIRVGSLDGPIDSEGRLTVRGVSTGFEFSLGNIRERTLVPVRLRLFDAGGGFRSELRGHVSGLLDTPRVQGDLSAEGDILAAVIQSVAPQSLPGFLAQPFSLAGKLDASPEGAALESLTLKLGETSANGSISARLGDIPSVTAQLAAGTIDLDTWLSMPEVRAPAGGAAPAEAPADRDANVAASGGEPAADSAPAAGTAGPLLPTGITVEVTAKVEAVAFRGKSMHQIQAAGTLAQGEVTISQFSALLPGGADAALFGFLTAADGQPRFEGDLEARATDLAGLLTWLGADVADSPLARLRSLAAKTSIVATPGRLQARSLDVQVDRSHITGAAAVDLGEPLRVDADLAVDRINLDDLLGASAASADGDTPSASPAETAGTAAPRRGDAPAGRAPQEPAAMPEADVKLRVGSATWRGVPIEAITFDGSLKDGDLIIRDARVGSVAKASAEIAGVLRDPTGDLRFQDVSLKATVPEPERLARLFEVALPPEVQALGAIGIDGTIDGPPSEPRLDMTVEAAGSRLSAAGTAAQDPEGLVFNGTIGLRSADVGRLVGTLTDYRPAGPLGATDLRAALESTPGSVRIGDLDGTLAGVTLGGTVAADYGGDRPSVRADLTTGDLVIDHFLPATRASALPWRLIPAAWTATPTRPTTDDPALLPAAVSQRWSREPIDVSALRGLDADVKLRSRSIRYGRYALANADVAATLEGGVLTVPNLTGSLFGGPVRGSGRIDARDAPTFTLDVAGEDMQLGQATGKATGRATLDAALQGRGASEAEIVSSLAGQGSLAVRGLDVKSDPTAMPILGPLLGAVIGPARILDKSLGGILGAMGSDGGDTGVAGASARFTVTDGIVRSDDIRFSTPAYSADAAGTIDLPQWYMDVAGTIALSQNLVGTLLQGIKELPKTIAFRAQGAPDDPKVDVDLSALTSVTIPALDQIKKRSPEAGRILEQVLPGLGGGGGGGDAPPASGTDDAPPPKPEKVLEDAIRGLFR